MYDSTIDILYNLYDLVTVGGYIIVDDRWFVAGGEGRPDPAMANVWREAGAADFRKLHGISEPMKDIDGAGAYFQKTHEVALRRSIHQLAVRKPPKQTPT